MPYRETPLLPGSSYHIYNRGVNGEKIFFSERNSLYFINRLAYFIDQKADLLAYCLMPNHFHLLVRVKTENFTQAVLKPFFTSYVRAVNLDQQRTGPLFQGRYRVKEIEDESNLMICMKYIHLNPVKANLVSSPEDWKYSSYSDYFLGKRHSLTQTTLAFDFLVQEKTWSITQPMT